MSVTVLDSNSYIFDELDENGAVRFDAFLDRNYPNWREQAGSDREATGIHRRWALDIDDIERNAIYRGEYVEIYDEYFESNRGEDVLIHTPQHRICAIDGDTTPVAVWGKS